MVAHPDLIQRPIVEKGEKVILARPAESVERTSLNLPFRTLHSRQFVLIRH